MDFLESFNQHTLKAPSLFHSLQTEARETIHAKGIPNRKDEAYKYTSLENELNHFHVQSETNKASIDLHQLKDKRFTNLFFINSELQTESDKADLIIEKNSEKSLKIITKNKLAHKNDFLYNLNLSTTENYTHIEVSKNKIIEKPIIIFHINTSSFESQYFTFDIGDNAELKVLNVYLTDSKERQLGTISQSVLMGENAKFINIHHQDYNHNSFFNCNISAQISKNANFENFTTTIGAKKSRFNLHLDLNGEGAQGTASGVYTLKDSQHSDIHSYISHNSPHSESHQLYKGIMNDKSRGVFTGLIKVQKDAQLINSNQLNRNLLLTKGAQVNSCPQLEIFADDVKCSHGSTTGQLSEDELFYFKSRGIREEKAKMMLARAFTYDVLLKIKNNDIRNFLHEEITEKFESHIFGNES